MPGSLIERLRVVASTFAGLFWFSTLAVAVTLPFAGPIGEALLNPDTPAEYAAVYFALREELEKLFAKPVDLVTPAGLANPYFRQRVEQEKTLLYAA